MTQAHSVLHELDLAPSLEEIAALMHNNRKTLHKECSALEFTCNVWHEKTMMKSPGKKLCTILLRSRMIAK
jgi:hypothetical protein